MDQLKRKINVTEAMAASIAITEEEKIANVNIEYEDSLIEKCAGIHIHQPTIENIEVFVRKYIMNELSFFPKVLEVNLEIFPNSFNKVQKSFVEDASGIVKIKIQKKTLELPFLVRDGELMPFDVIQMDGQRVPFSRENLKKLVVNLDHAQTKSQQQNGIESAYLGIENPTNPATVPGFMGDVMYIRDTQINRRPNDSRMLVTASEKIEFNLDSMIEKIANLKPMSEEEFKTIEYVLKKKAADELEHEFEKIASIDEEELPTRQDIKAFERLNKFNFEDANNLNNGTFIVFPEIKKEHGTAEITLTPAVVISDFLEVTEKESIDMKIVVSYDGRMKVLTKREPFLCKKTENKAFKLPTVSIKSLSDKDIFFALKGDKTIPPSIVLKTRNANRFTHLHDFGKPDNSLSDKTLVVEARSIKSSEAASMFTDSDDEKENRDYYYFGTYPISILNDSKFEYIDYSEFVRRKALELGTSQENIIALISKEVVCNKRYKNGKARVISDKPLCTDPDTSVIKIKGAINTNIKSKEDFDNLYKLSSVGYDITDTEKIAAAMGDNIKVECIDRSMKLYNVTVNFRDTDKRMMNARRLQFNRCSEGQLRAILRILKFEGQKVNEINFKAKNEPRAEYPLPFNCTVADIKKLEGGELKNISTQNVKDAVNKFINPQNVAIAVATALTSELAADALKKTVPAGNKVFETLRKFANESSALSAQFEKLAVEHESEEYLDYAKTMMISSLFGEKVAEVINSNESYPSIVDFSNELLRVKPYFEKVAYDLLERKINQEVLSVHEVPLSYLGRAINSLDNMCKIAYAVDNAKDIEGLKFK